MKAIICGANGAMGKLIDALLGDKVVGRVSIDGENNVPKTFAELGDVGADIIVDFSHHTAVADVISYAKAHHCAVVVGTTGHTAEEKELIYQAAELLPVFYSGNMSLGIAVLCRLARQAAAAFPDADIEIVEVHHNRKVDAPSGTAKMLFEAVKAMLPPGLNFKPVYKYFANGESENEEEQRVINWLRKKKSGAEGENINKAFGFSDSSI
mgnify:CR=1 FL=1